MQFHAITVFCLLSTLAAQQSQRGLDPDAAGPAQRIWFSKEQPHQDLWFRRAFSAAKAAKTATLVFSCDNRCTVFLNGKQVAVGDDWEKLTIVDVSRALLTGDNLLAVHAVNEGSCAAMVMWLYWEEADGTHSEIVTGKAWRVSDEEIAGWQQGKFDDGKWQAARELGATAFGKNVHNGQPRALLFRTIFAEPADRIAQSVDALRRARNTDEAQKAIDAIDRAVMAARAAIWKAREAEKRAEQGKRQR